MKEINKKLLREALIDEGYIESFGLDNTVENLLNLRNLDDKSAYDMLVTWLETGKLTPFQSVEGIDLTFLLTTLQMKAPAAILAYGMLLYDPKRNAIVLKNEADRRMTYVHK